MKRSLPYFRNTVGAFADGAVLFPLLALLSMKAGFSSITVLWTAGVAYLIAALVFRVPMSVQPLKSIAVAAVAVGATFTEVRLSGLVLGVFCVILCLWDVNRIAQRVSPAVIHQLQLGLGVLLVLQGLNAGGMMILLGAVALVLVPEVGGLPLLGLVATVGLFAAVFLGSGEEPLRVLSEAPSGARFEMIVSLVLPQLALTLTNSVVATRDVAHRYFGSGASRVTVRSLLASIGLGNIFVALVGGMPFCHGSGGVTAHVRGGSTRAWSTALMGLVLVGLAGVQAIQGARALAYPPILVGALLVATGVFHLQLAKPTAGTVDGKIKLACALILTLLTRNLLIVLGGAVALEFCFSALESRLRLRG